MRAQSKCNELIENDNGKIPCSNIKAAAAALHYIIYNCDAAADTWVENAPNSLPFVDLSTTISILEFPF